MSRREPLLLEPSDIIEIRQYGPGPVSSFDIGQPKNKRRVPYGHSGVHLVLSCHGRTWSPDAKVYDVSSAGGWFLVSDPGYPGDWILDVRILTNTGPVRCFVEQSRIELISRRDK